MPANETAEAILIVIKRILKWVLVSISILFSIGVLIYGLASFYDWYSIDRHRLKVEAVASFDSEKCTKEYPLFIGVVNNSKKTVDKVTIYVKVTKKGYSTQLNYDTSYSIDKILAPSEGWGGCVTVLDNHYDWAKRKPLDGKDMAVTISTFYPTFQ